MENKDDLSHICATHVLTVVVDSADSLGQIPEFIRAITRPRNHSFLLALDIPSQQFKFYL